MISHPRNTEAICQALLDVDPQCLLDVGTGLGKYALLARECAISTAAEPGNLTPDDLLIIDGWEIAPYFNPERFPWLDSLYNRFFTGNVLNLSSSALDEYDMAILIDVVEHWPIEVGVAFVNRLLDLGIAVLISTPRDPVMYEPEFYGVECPKHQSRWTLDEFYSITDPPNWADYSTDISWVLLARPL